MRTEEAIFLDDAAFAESAEIAAALPELRQQLAAEREAREDVGMRALFANPEALSRPLRRQLY